MEKPWHYRGRAVSVADIAFIRELIGADPEASRYRLSRRLCAAWGWKQPNGVLRDMVCRGLLLQLDRAGENCQRCVSARREIRWPIGGGPNRWRPTRGRCVDR